ncbi:MAG: hypothetical protein NTW86_10585 [Candidatus Sumerlaeota bacterium]|nr:hypothetical protein [Candidatus Sumerlaeota bacterium]
MNSIGWCHVASAVYLAFVVSLVISVNDGETPKRIGRETLRRWAKLLGGLILIGLIVEGLTLLG